MKEVDLVSLGRVIEEALNDMDETELTNVINSLTPEQIAVIMKLVPERHSVYALSAQQWEDVAILLQGEPDALGI